MLGWGFHSGATDGYLRSSLPIRVPDMRKMTFRRVLAAFLACQPVLWMSNVALAQAIQAPYLAPPTAGTIVPGDSEPFHPEQRPGPTSGTPVPLAATVMPPVDEPLDPDAYVCGPGDVLELNFWGVQNFKLRVAVDLEGRAFVAKIGYLKLQGKTLTEARRLMRESVARFFPRLSFDVTLAEPRTFLVQVVDDVVHPASYPARAIDRVGTIIARAGGFGPNASRRRIEIRRRDGMVLRADLLLYTITGDVKYNPYLLDGDVVRVPFEELAASIDGAVNRAGRYELIGTRDLAELVELGGGMSPLATQLLPVTVVRRMPDDRQDLKLLDFPKSGVLPAAVVQHEDRVTIPSFAEVQQSVMVIGAIVGAAAAAGTATSGSSGATTGAVAPDEVSATRRVPFVQGDSVRTLLERVGGVGPLADLNGAYVLRGGKSLPVDLYSLVMLRELKADRPIELGDTLVVPFKRRNILVEGAVFKPGAYPFNPNYQIEHYLSLAGGRSRFAQSLSNVRVVTPNGETKEYERDLKLEPGSSVVVPERNFTRAEVVQILLSAASILVSGVAVVIAARK